MRVELTARVGSNHTITVTHDKLEPGKLVRVTIDNDDAHGNIVARNHDKQKILDDLLSYAGESDIITPDGLILREDAYGGR